MLRSVLIKKYVNTSDIKWIIGHSPIVHLKEAFVMIVLLFLLYVVYAVLNHYSPAEYRKWIAGGIGLLLCIKWILDFLNLYLDCLILTDEYAILFLREGWLEYKTEFFGWDKISTISSSQNGLRNKLRSVGDIVIKLEFNTEFPFTDVLHPKKQVSKLMMLKENFLTSKKYTIEKDLEEDNQRFNVLVEAMSEVVKEYMEKQPR